MKTPQKGDKIRLIAKTNFGKNRIAQHGDTFTLKQNPAPDGRMLLENETDMRWVRLVSDADFDWEIVTPTTTRPEESNEA